MKMEDSIRELKGVQSASINFATKTLLLTMEEELDRSQFDEIHRRISNVEAGAKILWEDEEVKEEKPSYFKLLLPIALFFGAMLLEEGTGKSIILLIAYVLSGYKVIWTALRNILRGDFFDENFLMTIASGGAIAIGEMGEGVAVMIFYSVGEFLQDLAVDKSRKSIADLMNLQGETANVLRDGELITLDPAEVEVGEVILVKPGERIPLDGIVRSGMGELDMAALTGESIPQTVREGDHVLSGCVNLNATLRITTTKAYEDSTVAKILEMVEESATKKAVTEKFITRFARVYTPIVVGAAVLLVLIPVLLFQQDFNTWIYRALVFLVASCPCALVVSIPLGFFAGIGRASKSGILVKGGNYLEAMGAVDHLVLDKTGTLTEGKFRVVKILPQAGTSEEELLETAALAESFSDHPIAKSILEAYGKEIGTDAEDQLIDHSGEGIELLRQGRQILAGNARLMKRFGIEIPGLEESGTVVYVAKEGVFIGSLFIADQIKEEAKGSLAELKAMGISKITMLTGDNPSAAERVGKQLEIKDIRAGLLPDEKAKAVEELLKEKGESKLAFVGDGINDAPVLTLSDVGIAMGSLGTDAAIEAADVVIMNDKLSSLPKLVQISRKTMRIIRQNVIFALGFKAVVLVLGALGYASMWVAVFADTGVALLAILNSVRILYGKTEVE
ncbi:MAG: heavy metal translocating P-type ATPase [Tissierellia bacterium]|nr:heavy metal translocating P-type ATPase [Tissierellia bacterium]